MRDELTEEQKWQKNYLKGVSPSGLSKADVNHRIKRTLKTPIRSRQQTEPGQKATGSDVPVGDPAES
jgi:hypothetical protein